MVRYRTDRMENRLMRHPPSSRLSYRNVLIAAALAAGLEVGTVYVGSGQASAAQPHRGDASRDEAGEASACSHPQPDHSQAR